MRITLIDTLVLGGLWVGGIAFGFFCGSLLGVGPDTLGGLSLLLGLIAALTLASPIYARFHLPPLFLPACPACKSRPQCYQTVSPAWPLLQLRCGACQSEFLACLTRSIPAGTLEVHRTVIRVRWPEFLGRWVAVKTGSLEDRTGRDGNA
jgi:hypothetical protein